MHVLIRTVRVLLLATVFGASGAAADDSTLGLFDAQGDIGAPARAGSATFDGNRFTIAAAGANMMGTHDEFHFVWREVKGDFAISARVVFTGPGVEAHRKAGLMARAGLGDAAAYVDATVHGDGPRALQVRRSDGGQTEMLVAAGPAPGPEIVQLERHGSRFAVSMRGEGQPEVRRELTDANLPDTLYVGMFVCAHNPGVVETAQFDKVRLKQSR
jgi:hypothetical protein